MSELYLIRPDAEVFRSEMAITLAVPMVTVTSLRLNPHAIARRVKVRVSNRSLHRHPGNAAEVLSSAVAHTRGVITAVASFARLLGRAIALSATARVMKASLQRGFPIRNSAIRSVPASWPASLVATAHTSRATTATT